MSNTERRCRHVDCADCGCKGEARFACAQAGCGECLRSLLREHSGLVYRMVNRLAQGKVECADLFQEGRIGLWQAKCLWFQQRVSFAF
jgi:DNA-directed RNA polymerase specialized sigma24 family protein